MDGADVRGNVIGEAVSCPQHLRGHDAPMYREPFVDPLDLKMLEALCLGFTQQEAAAIAGYASKDSLQRRLKKLYQLSGMDNVVSLIAWCFRKGYLQ